MAAKKSSKTTKTVATTSIKFTKGGFYQDARGNLWCCATGRTKTSGGQQVVLMQAAQEGHATGEATEELVEAFVKQLSPAELEEYREVCQREKEAEAAAKAKTEAKPAKTPKAKQQVPADKPKKMSALDAAAKVLEESGEPMASKEMIEAMSTKGYWTSPGGQTPHATLYAAILREINLKGAESRFTKTDRGRFAVNAGSKN